MISNNKSVSRRELAESAAFSHRDISRSWSRSHSPSCCSSLPDYFSGARSRLLDLIPDLSRPEI